MHRRIARQAAPQLRPGRLAAPAFRQLLAPPHSAGPSLFCVSEMPNGIYPNNRFRNIYGELQPKFDTKLHEV